MGIFNVFKGRQKIAGYIGYFELTDWWLSDFSRNEQKYIIETFRPFSFEDEAAKTKPGEILVKGKVSLTNSIINFLTNLASWFSKPKDRTIAYRILNKAEKLINEKTEILDIHFLLGGKAKIYYRNRNDDPNALKIAIEVCKKQIELAPQASLAFKKEYPEMPLPSHYGFEQLAIIEEKQKNYNEAIKISESALEQGWGGDWEKRIDRCSKKMIA